MRYLYGDSVEFPLQFNFLATLEVFMTHATRVVQLEAETQKQSLAAASASKARIQSIESVEQLHERAMRAIGDALDATNAGPRGTMVMEDPEHAPSPVVVEYTKRLMAFAERFIEEQRTLAKTATEAEGSQLLADTDRRAADIRAELESLFRTAKLQVLGTRFAMKLRDDKPAVGAVFLNPDGIVSHFELGASRVVAWQHPRKVSDFVQNVELQIGVKKAFFKGTVSPDAVKLDEWIISRFDAAPESFEMSVRKKIDQKDLFVIKLTQTKNGVAGDVERLEDPNGKALPGAMIAADVAVAEKIWQALRLECASLMDYREKLTRLELDGKDVFAEHLALEVVRRLVATLAPTVREIAQRSPSAEELSLKKENDDGRREEIYLKKDELLAKLQPLPASGREVFAPLGLESWVPSLSMRPPPVR
jgi:hypothetical protein